MDCTKLLNNLKQRGFSAQYFDTAAEASAYLCDALKGETIGFGGSITLESMRLYEQLEKENTVCWHWKDPAALKRFAEFTAYITSANAVAQTGELVNIDGTGNRLAGTLFGGKKLYFVCGVNKIAPDLTGAIDRARNVAAPANAKRLNRKTPCVVTGKCHDCNSPERICRGMAIHMQPMNSFESTEVLIIGEQLGY